MKKARGVTKRDVQRTARRTAQASRHSGAFWLMLCMRLLYLLGIIVQAFQHSWSSVIFNLIIFIGSLFVPWLGRKDESFYMLDALIMSVFVLSLIYDFFGLWTEPTTLLRTALGSDKLLHTAAGACLAMFAAIFLRRRVKDPMTFYVGIVLFALAIGGLWEIFEWTFSILPAPFTLPSAGYADTMLDMVADTLGAVILVVVLRLRRYF